MTCGVPSPGLRAVGAHGGGGPPRLFLVLRGLDAARRAAPQLWSGERPELCLDAEEVLVTA